MANKRRNNRLPVYISGDAFSCFSFTVTALHDDVHIYIRGSNLPPAWKEREKKRRSCRQLSANRRGSFTRFFLPPRRFILRVVAFFFANSNGENGLYEAEAIDNFPAPVSISFMPFLMSITIGHRAIILRFCEIIVQLYLLFFSILVFSSLF